MQSFSLIVHIDSVHFKQRQSQQIHMSSKEGKKTSSFRQKSVQKQAQWWQLSAVPVCCKRREKSRAQTDRAGLSRTDQWRHSGVKSQRCQLENTDSLSLINFCKKKNKHNWSAEHLLSFLLPHSVSLTSFIFLCSFLRSEFASWPHLAQHEQPRIITSMSVLLGWTVQLYNNDIRQPCVGIRRILMCLAFCFLIVLNCC